MMGRYTGRYAQSGDTFIGTEAGVVASGGGNTALGYRALRAGLTATYYN